MPPSHTGLLLPHVPPTLFSTQWPEGSSRPQSDYGIPLVKPHPSKGCSSHSEWSPTIGFKDAHHLVIWPSAGPRCPSSRHNGLPCTYKTEAQSAPSLVSTDCCCLYWDTLPADSLMTRSHISLSSLHWHVNFISEAFSNHNIQWAIPRHFPYSFFLIGLKTPGILFTCSSVSPLETKFQ